MGYSDHQVDGTKVSPFSWFVAEGSQYGVHEDVEGVASACCLVEALVEAGTGVQAEEEQQEEVEE